ncbi:ABC transporter substrate-binding protein [Methylobacterium oryzihabitans]|uniref:ABC transporter substrate-binding protein n=1 Tax=Methylobacterium oryzihabitans TaxID=2499852 RepID=A0A437NWH1_9HYPH|nr:ABC transporter substrate-binding protein [Methylobacterium oryzihabitans]RVU14258.1 ABC transporter substrate-binding protein [Methylobacterium oryzihabitans]
MDEATLDGIARRTSDRRTVLKSLGAGAAALALGRPALAQSSEPLRIGMIVTYSGPYADYGRQMDNGMALWLKQNGGKVAGREVAIIKRDTAGPAPDLATRFARELITRDKVDAIMGLDFSPNAIAIGPVLSQAKIPCIVLNASASVIPSKSPYFARISFTVGQVSAPMGTWAGRQGTKTAMTLVSDYGPGADAEKAFGQSFAAAGGKVVGALRAPLSNPDFSAFVQRIRDEKPEAAFFFFPSGDLPNNFLKAARERGLAEAGIRLLATGEAMDDSYMQAAGDAGLGLITTHHYSTAHPSDLNRRFVAGYRAEHGDYAPNYMAMTAYDGLAALDAALAKSGGKGGDALMTALRGLAFESPRGPIEIGPETRDIVQTVYVRRTERIDGRLVCTEFDKFDRVTDPLA